MTNGQGKTAVVSGASAGIGAAAARMLAARGWRVIALGRNRARSEAALAGMKRAAPDARIDFVLADLSVLAQAERAAQEVIALAGGRIDLLVNNAGGTQDARHETVDGFEETFAANHLGPFLLTLRLLPLLRAAGNGAQIINVASVAHTFTKDMHWDDLQLARNFNLTQAYAQAKLANILFARELARREGPAIRANAMHPGMVASNFPAHGNLLIRTLYRLAKPFILTSDQGADTILWLATAAEAAGLTGGYFEKRKPGRETPAAGSAEGAKRLWQTSEALLAAKGFAV